MSLAQDRLLQLATDISNLTGELSGALGTTISLQHSIDDRNTVILDLQTQIGVLNVALADKTGQETADQQQIAALTAQLTAAQAALTTCQTALAADEAILHPPPPPPAPIGAPLGMANSGWWGSWYRPMWAGYQTAFGRAITSSQQTFIDQNRVSWGDFEGSANYLLGAAPLDLIRPTKVFLRFNPGIKKPGAPAGLTPTQVLAWQTVSSYQDINSGAQDAMFGRIFGSIAAMNLPDVNVCFNQEGDGDWFIGSSKFDPVGSLAAFRRLAVQARALIPGVKIWYDISAGQDLFAAYPGDDVVDGVVFDSYDRRAENWYDPAGGQGFAGLKDFCNAHNKPWYAAELGTQDGRDYRGFIDLCHRYLTEPGTRAVGWAWWDSGDAYDSAFGNNPLMKAYLLTKFGGLNPPVYLPPPPPPPPPPGTVSIRVNGWKSGGNPDSNLDLLINGVVQDPANQIGPCSWTVGKLRSGDQFKVRVNSPAGKWWTVTGVVGTNGDGVGNWSIMPPGGTLTIGTGTSVTFTVP